MEAPLTNEIKDLEQIIALQRANLVRNLTTEEWKDQGFVTVVHTIDLLIQMHSIAPAVVVKDEGRVVAYALVLRRECREIMPVFDRRFEAIDRLEWQGKPMNDLRYYIMGQICVDKEYRGKGLFDELYRKHKEAYSNNFDLIVTEIATRNTRSIRAHERVGFKTFSHYTDDRDDWAVVAWDWN